MLIDPVPIRPAGRGTRLVRLLSVATTVGALVAVLALAQPSSTSPDALGGSAPAGGSSEPPNHRLDVAGAERTALPSHAFTLAVRTVGKTLAGRRSGEITVGLVAVSGYLSVNPLAVECAGSPARLPAAFCRRSAAMSATVSSSAGPRLPSLIPPGTPLPPGIATAGGPPWRTYDAPPASRAVVIGRFVEPQAPSCADGTRCDDAFVVERVAWADGSWRERILVRDPMLPNAPIGVPARQAQVIASREADRGEAILTQAFLGPNLLRLVDRAAADAAAASTRGPVWYIRSVASARVGSGQRLVAWVVIDDASGFVLATGPPATD
jgi:hypothetical protein